MKTDFSKISKPEYAIVSVFMKSARHLRDSNTIDEIFADAWCRLNAFLRIISVVLLSVGLATAGDNTGDENSPFSNPLPGSPNWEYSSVYSFGSGLSPAGDVNGDGYGDIIVAAKEHSTNYTNDGKVFLFYGSANGPSASPDWSAIGANGSSAFGHSISTAGDVNGDGYSDIIIGEPGFKVSGVSRGRASVYLGSPTGLPAAPDWTVVGTTMDLGRSVTTAGDVNGDGYSDIVVTTAYGTIDSGATLGAAFLYLGSASGLSSTPAWEVNGSLYFENFGNSACTAGDVNGDGFSDVIIGAPEYSGGGNKRGAAYLFHGSASGLSSSADWFQTGQDVGFKFGYIVYTAGDVNGDGFSDVVIGAPDSGKAFVYHGSSSGLSASADWSISRSSTSGFGFSASTAGDINGDGYSDVVISATVSEQAFVYQGSETGLGTNEVWSVSDEGSVSAFGFNVRIAGDVNGDGYSDIFISGYSPKAYVYNGSPSGIPSAYNWIYSPGSGNSGWSVASAGDINGDGYSEVIVGNPNYSNGTFAVGRFTIFNGSANGAPASPSFTKTGSSSGSAIYRVGRCVAPAGDVNGDGYADIVVGVMNGVFGSYENGGAEVYYGSPGGISQTPSWTISSDQNGDNFGYSVASAGDVNGDGYSDIVVGAHGRNSYSGAAYVFYGSDSGLSTNADWSVNGPGGSWYGYSVSGAGDVNGDGYGDVVVGAHRLGTAYGGAYVYHGSATGLSLTHNWHHQSANPNSNYGISVACAGDVNGDGYSDVLVGQNKYLLYPIEAGAAMCYYGSPTGLNPLYPEWFVEAVDPYFAHEFGGCVASAGDVNGDGYSDVLIGAPYPFGNVYCYYGSSGGLPVAFNRNLSVTSPYSPRFGYSTASAGDVNGDGYSDVVAGAHFVNGGHTFLFYGNSPGKSAYVNQFKPTGSDIVGPGGWTGSSGNVKYGIFGRSPFGRADGKIVYEHKVHGSGFSPLTNTAGSGQSSSYQDLGTNGMMVNSNASGLNSGSKYRWRARIKYSSVNNPYQKLGPWRFYNSQNSLPFEGFQPKEIFTAPLIPAHALNFDGVNDHAELPDALTASLTSGNGFTLEYWYKGTGHASAICFSSPAGYIIAGYQGKHVISSDSGAAGGIDVGNVDDGQWHHIAVTWERNKPNGFRSYVDGFLTDQRNSSDAELPAITTGGKLGGIPDSSLYLSGTLDKVRIWNRSMTEDEIVYRSFCDLNAPGYGLLANYSFNQGYSNYNNNTETTVYDSSNNLYNATLINFALQGATSNWTDPGAPDSGFPCSNSLGLNLSVIPQGFYNNSGRLNKRDTVTAYLRQDFAPYSIVDSAESVIDSVTFTGTFRFYNSPAGNYLISVKHRNSIETWSAYSESFNIFSDVPFSFIYQRGSAYGNNLVLVGQTNFPYAIYSGDVSQDGVVDGTDAAIIDNDAANFASGYLPTDLNGDDVTDGSDAVIADNNAANFVTVIRP